MRISWTLNSQPMFQQAAHLLGAISWRTVGHHLMQQAASWYQPVVKWVQEEEPPLFIKAQAEETYRYAQAWRRDFRKQVRQLQQTIVAQYRQGMFVSPEQLRAALLTQQADFDADTVSPLYYTHHLKRLAQRLPRYAHTLEGVAEALRDQLKAQPAEAIRYFYNELVNQLIDSSQNTAATVEVIRISLKNVFTYYHALVPADLWQTIQSVINNTLKQASTTPLSTPPIKKHTMRC